MARLRLQLQAMICALILSSGAFASATGEECFRSEIDPSTKRVYQNKAQWDADQKAIWALAAGPPNPFRLLRGYEVSMSESKNSKGMGSDKRKHCYVGCRIADEVGHDVAIFAGIYKEDRDITDCRTKTLFDPADLEATILGADLAKRNADRSDAAFCREECLRAIKK
jgi:hypothetical protein